MTLWSITRRDGVVLRVTNSDRQIFFEGELYDPDNAVNASATARSEGLSPHDRTLTGVVSNESITLNQLQAGLLRNAVVNEIIVDRKYPWAGAALRKRYQVGKVKFTDSTWEVQVRTLAGRLQHQIGNVYSRICRFTLGDSKCGVNLGQFQTELLTVSSVSAPCNTRTEFEFTSQGYVDDRADGYANFGFLTFLSGLNAGFTVEIQSETRQGGGAVTLLLLDPTPFDIDLGDSFRVTAGCDRTMATCRDKFDNLVRFGGFPTMPGIDAAVQQSIQV